MPLLPPITLDAFIETNRDELIGRCRANVMKRFPAPSEIEVSLGIPLFLSQLVETIRLGPSQTGSINTTAIKHGHDLFIQGFSIGEVVHDYGDVCQVITGLALEQGAPISTDDFRTLNRCLDDAIAGAVTEYNREQDVPRDGELHHVRHLTESTITAFEAVKSGRVGVGGSTGDLIHSNLMAIRAALAGHLGDEVPPPPIAKVNS